MPISDDQIVDLIKTSATTAAIVSNLQQRLFGDGSAGAGAVAKLYELGETHHEAALKLVKDHTEQDVKDFDSIRKELTIIKGWRNGDKKWVAGAVAVLVVEGGVLGFLIEHFASVAALARALK